MKNKTTVIGLTGGFGNQMFQFAYALYLDEVHNHDITLDFSIGNPRKTGNLSSICRMSIANKKICGSSNQFRTSRFYSKVFGWNISRSVKDNSSQQIYRLFMTQVSRLLFAIRYRKVLSLTVATNLGYDEKLLNPRPGVIIGYFQTSKFAENPSVMRRLQTIECDSDSNDFIQWVNKARLVQPIMLHLRLTDYLKEESFGIPDINYYRRAIQLHRANGNLAAIWVFSDEIDLAKRLLAELDTENEFLYFSDSKLEDVEIWSLMRKASGFIIANSTFSWWAAFLRDNQTAMVCYPRPWFAGMKDPESLCPDNWVGVDLT
jgi:hypothetical protein